MMVYRAWQRMRRLSDHYAGALLVGVLSGVVVYNVRQWRRDQTLPAWRQPPGNEIAEMPVSGPKVSILAAAWNEAHLLERHLTRILALPYPNKEYIVCAGGSDGSYGIAKGFEGRGIAVLEQYLGEGKQHALQRCFEASTGDVVVLMDTDVVPEPGAVAALVSSWLREGDPATATHLRPLPEQFGEAFVLYQWASQAYTAAHYGQYAKGLLGMLCAVGRKELEAVDGFAQPVQTGTDYFLSKRLEGQGVRIQYVRSATGATEFPSQFSEYRRQQSRWLRNVVLHGWRFGERSEWVAGLRTILLGWAMLVAPFLTPLLGSAWLALWLAALVHRLLAHTRYIATVQRLEGLPWQPSWYLRLPMYVIADFVVWASTLRDLASEAARGRW